MSDTEWIMAHRGERCPAAEDVAGTVHRCWHQVGHTGIETTDGEHRCACGFTWRQTTVNR